MIYAIRYCFPQRSCDFGVEHISAMILFLKFFVRCVYIQRCKYTSLFQLNFSARDHTVSAGGGPTQSIFVFANLAIRSYFRVGIPGWRSMRLFRHTAGIVLTDYGTMTRIVSSAAFRHFCVKLQNTQLGRCQ
jgi:hypothetical protein